MPLPLRQGRLRYCFDIAVVPFHSGSIAAASTIRLPLPGKPGCYNRIVRTSWFSRFPPSPCASSFQPAETDFPKFTRLGSAIQLASQEAFPHPHLPFPTNCRVKKSRAYARTIHRKGQPVTNAFPRTHCFHSFCPLETRREFRG